VMIVGCDGKAVQLAELSWREDDLVGGDVHFRPAYSLGAGIGAM
jgi:hypothetical protein